MCWIFQDGCGRFLEFKSQWSSRLERFRKIRAKMTRRGRDRTGADVSMFRSHSSLALNDNSIVSASLADDFESKFQFHPVEDLPPPEEFKPFPRVYPSKENRGRHSALLFCQNLPMTPVSPPPSSSSLLLSEPQTPWDEDTPQMSHADPTDRLDPPPERLLALCVFVNMCVHAGSRLMQTTWPLTFSSVECFECVWGGGVCARMLQGWWYSRSCMQRESCRRLLNWNIFISPSDHHCCRDVVVFLKLQQPSAAKVQFCDATDFLCGPSNLRFIHLFVHHGARVHVRHF